VRKEKLLSFFTLLEEYSLYAMLFFLPISKAALGILFSLAISGFLGKKIIRPDFKVFKSLSNLFLLLFLCFMAFSLVNSGQYISKSLIALFLKWGKYILVFLIFQDALTDKNRVKKAVMVFLISAGLVSLDSIYQLFTGFDFFRHKNLIDMGKGVYAARAAFNNYNSLAAYLVVSLSLMVVLVNELKERVKISVAWVLLLISGAAFLYTFSRGGWTGFFFALLLILIMSPKARNIFMFFIVFFAIILAIPQTRERFIFIFKPGGDANRFINWQIALNMIKERPFLGKGAGLFMDYFPRNLAGVIVGYAHNCFLQIWAETGVFSLLSFLGFLVTFFGKGLKAFLQTKDFLILGLLAGLFGFTVHSFFDTHFYSLQLAYLFWSMAGVLASLITIKQMECAKSL